MNISHRRRLAMLETLSQNRPDPEAMKRNTAGLRLAVEIMLAARRGKRRKGESVTAFQARVSGLPVKECRRLRRVKNSVISISAAHIDRLEKTGREERLEGESGHDN
jgi:hypothetical protein